MRRRFPHGACGAIACAAALTSLLGCGGAAVQRARTRLPGVPVVELLPQGEARGRAVLAAVFAGGEHPADALRLAHLVAGRMPLDEAAAPVHPGDRSARFSLPLEDGDGARALRRLREALGAPVTAQELARDRARLEAFAALPALSPADAALARCRGELHRQEKDQSPPPRALETLRASWPAAGVSVVVAAPDGQHGALRSELARRGEWAARGDAQPPAEAPEDGWLRPASSAHGAAHWLWPQDGAHAGALLALGRMLEHPSALSLPLSALQSGAELSAVHVALQPLQGACMDVTLRFPEPVDEAQLGDALQLTEQRLRALWPEAQRRADSTPALVGEGAESELQLSEIRAYYALAEHTPARAPRTQLVLQWPQPQGEPGLLREPAGLIERLLRKARSKSEGSEGAALPLAHSLRPGAPESWLLLASPCGAGGEGEDSAGAAAAYALAVASRIGELSGGEAIPWVDPQRVGVLWRASPHAGESPRALGERLGVAAARAWLGEGLELDVAIRSLWRADTRFALSASHALPTLGAIPLPFALGDAHLALALGGPGDVSSVRPFGSARSHGNLQRALVRLRGEALARGPWAASMLTADAEAAHGAQAALSALLPRSGPCPAAAGDAAVAAPRPLQLRLEDDGRVLLLALQVPPSLDSRTLAAAAHYFEAATRSALQGQIRALQLQHLGARDSRTRALVWRIDAPREQHRAIAQQWQRLLHRLASADTASTPGVREALASERAERAREQRSRHTELLELWRTAQGQPAGPDAAPSEGALQRALRQLSARDNLIVVQPERLE